MASMTASYWSAGSLRLSATASVSALASACATEARASTSAWRAALNACSSTSLGRVLGRTVLRSPVRIQPGALCMTRGVTLRATACVPRPVAAVARRTPGISLPATLT
jgi:hypothetical protein